MNSEKYYTIAVCSANINKDYNDIIFRALNRHAARFHCKLLFFHAFSDLFNYRDRDKHAIGESSIFQLINYDILDAIILLPRTIKSTDLLKDIITKAQVHHLPVVSINQVIDGCYSIQFDERGAFKQIISHLIEEHHCRRINFLAGGRDNSESEARLEAYREVMAAYQIPVEEERIGYGDFWFEPAQQAVKQFLESGLPLPDAIVCANDAMAIAAYEYLVDSGYHVPDDIIVTGYDGIEQALDHTPSITTSRYRYEDAIIHALEVLTNYFIGQPFPEQRLLPNQFLPGFSCGCQSDAAEHGDQLTRKLYSRLDRAQYFSYMQIDMMAKLTDSNSFTDLFTTLMEYSGNFQSPAFWLCIVDDFLMEEELSDIMEQAAFHHSGYSDHMDIMLSCIRDEWQGITDFPTSELLPKLGAVLEEFDSIMFLPLHALDQTIGYVALAYDPDIFNMQYAYQFMMNVSNALERTKTHQRQQNIISSLENKYIHDPMTGLLNRRGFYQKIMPMFEGRTQTQEEMMIASVDLNGLKVINDTYGHADGDIAISTVARALSGSVDMTQVCARFGGDEFVVAGTIKNHEAIDGFRSRFQIFLDDYNTTSNKPYLISASVGIISCLPSDNITFDELLKAADEEMYKEKVLHHQSR